MRGDEAFVWLSVKKIRQSEIYRNGNYFMAGANFFIRSLGSTVCVYMCALEEFFQLRKSCLLNKKKFCLFKKLQYVKEKFRELRNEKSFNEQREKI